MIYDPELKAMSDIYDSLQSLDPSTRTRVVDWVMSKLNSHPSTTSSKGSKRGLKPGKKRVGKRRGRKPRQVSSTSGLPSIGAKRSPKQGKKRGPKPGSKRKGKRGRPLGS